MARIVFVLDFEPGHLFPTFSLAAALRARGHDVRYLGIADIEEQVRRQGFEITTIFADVYPRGRPAEIRRAAAARGPSGSLGDAGSIFFGDHYRSLLRGDLDEVMRELAPDLVIASIFTAVETLIMLYKYQLPTLIFTEYLRLPETTPVEMARGRLLMLGAVGYDLMKLAMAKGKTIRSLEQLVQPLAELQEVIACPAELDLPGTVRGPRVQHLGPGIRDPAAAVDDLSWPERAEPQKLIYVSLGSQVELYREPAARIFAAVFDFMRSAGDMELRFIVSLPEVFALDAFGEVPEWGSVQRWVPQVEVLRRASAMITHGGLGTVKECIYQGVPMLVLPIERDQPKNAERVAHHQLGSMLSIEELTSENLARALRAILEDPQIPVAHAEMRRIFHAREAEQRGVEIVEGMLR